MRERGELERAVVEVLWRAETPCSVRAVHDALADPGLAYTTVMAVRLRWVGHQLHAEAELVVDAELSLIDAHQVAADAEHHLAHAIPRLTRATVHTDPDSHPGAHHHAALSHQRRSTGPPE